MQKKSTFWVYIGVILVIGGALSFAILWMMPLHNVMKGFDVPKIVGIHVEGEPFVRIKLKPGWHLRPVDVMYGTNALVTCEVVAAPLGKIYKATMFGRTQRSTKDCRFRFKVTAPLGSQGNVTITYKFKTSKGWRVDRFNVPYRVIPAGRFIRIYTLEDVAHKPVKGPYCPTQRMYVYGTAALPFHPHGLVPLFFVENPLNPGPVLQVRVDRKKRIRPIRGKIVEFRRYGDKLNGLAFWSIEPVLVGPENVNHAVYNVYAGLFREEDIPKIVARCLKVLNISANHMSIQSRIHSIEDIRSAALAMTKAWPVIRSKPLQTHPTIKQ